MAQLFFTRLRDHWRTMAKYLRLVFNDFFVLALLFAVGGVSYSYANALKTVQPNQWWQPLIVILILVVGLQLGRFATLLQEADVVFLLPREHDMHAYLVRARWYSFIMATLIQVLVVLILSPFLVATHLMTVNNVICLGLLQLVLKDLWFNRELMGSYRGQAAFISAKWLIRWVLPLLLVSFSMVINPLLTLVVAVIIDGVYYVVAHRSWQQVPINWRLAIMNESSRMMTIYRFFNLFTDVPMVAGKVKRRKYLDWLLNRVPMTPDNTYRFLFSRGLVRGTEFTGLFLQLTLFGALMLIFIDQLYMSLGLAALFLFLIGFQLLPFYKQFDNIVFTHLYPINQGKKMQGFQHTLTSLLLTTGGIFSLVEFIFRSNWTQGLLMVGLVILEVFLLIKIYVPYRLKRA